MFKIKILFYNISIISIKKDSKSKNYKLKGLIEI
mgnify:CR=1 FL=1